MRLVCASLRLWLFAGLALTQVGCAKVGELAWVAGMGGGVLLQGILWGVGASLLGLGLGLGIYSLLNRGLLNRGRLKRGMSKGQVPEGILAMLLQMTGLVTLVGAMVVGLGFLGFFEGLLRGSTRALSEGEMVEKVYPVLGATGADVLGAVLLSGDLGAAVGSFEGAGAAADLVQGFRSGEQRIETAQIPSLLAAVDGEVVLRITESVGREAKDKISWVREGWGGRLFDGFLNSLGDALVRMTLEEGLQAQEPTSANLFGAMIRGLPQAAELDEEPEYLSHGDLSAYLVRETVAKGVVSLGLRPFFRAHQVAGAIPMLLALVFALVCFLLPRWLPNPEGGA